jgi:hypothetical protein
MSARAPKTYWLVRLMGKLLAKCVGTHLQEKYTVKNIAPVYATGEAGKRSTAKNMRDRKKNAIGQNRNGTDKH